MRNVRILSPVEAGGLIEDHAVVSVSSSSGLGCPDAVLAGIGAHFAATGSPREITTLHPIAAGDMSGIKGIDHLVAPGLLARVIAGSYPSGPSSLEPPLIWQAIESGSVQAYNLPSGVLFQMHRAAAAGQPGVFTRVGLDTFVDPRRQGGRMNAATTEQIVRVEHFDGEEWLFYRAIAPDVAIIRASTADEWGNLSYEDEGSTLGALDQAYAAHNNGGVVIAQVRRIAEGGSLHPQQVRVPGVLVDAVVVAPDQLQTTLTPNDPTLSGQLRTPLSVLEELDFSLQKVIARRATMELCRGETVNLGFGISALVPRILVEEGLASEVTWIIEQGAVGGVPLTDFAFGCAMNPQALMQSADQFTLLQGGGFDHAMLSFLEIDEQGNVNVHYLPSRRHVTAGIGGFADITSGAKSIVFSGTFTAGRRNIAIEDDRIAILTDGAQPKLVQRVAEVSFSGRRALAEGQRVLYVTERCVMELRPEGVTVVEISPGIDLQRDVLDRAEFRLLVADDLRETDSRVLRRELLGLSLDAEPATAVVTAPEMTDRVAL
jgi:propionate CoA-transferase